VTAVEGSKEEFLGKSGTWEDDGEPEEEQVRWSVSGNSMSGYSEPVTQNNSLVCVGSEAALSRAAGCL